MKTSSKDRNLAWIKNQAKKGNIAFDHKLQRPTGQWSPLDKSLLIHSLLIGFPINPIYVIEEYGKIYTIDGSQRTSTCIDYLNDKFALSQKTPDIVLLSNDEENKTVETTYELAGKKFSKLDPEVQEMLLTLSLTFCTISNYTDDEVREMFRRQNNGRPLNAKHLRVVYESDQFSDAIFSLATHPFMEKMLTKTQRKNGSDRDLIIQTLMLICTDNENDYTSFRKNNIDAFVASHDEEVLNEVPTLKFALDEFDTNFEELKLKATTIPMVLYAGWRVLDEHKSFTELVDKINDFIGGYEENEEYRELASSGTSAADKVKGRLNYWDNIVDSIENKKNIGQ